MYVFVLICFRLEGPMDMVDEFFYITQWANAHMYIISFMYMPVCVPSLNKAWLYYYYFVCNQALVRWPKAVTPQKQNKTASNTYKWCLNIYPWRTYQQLQSAHIQISSTNSLVGKPFVNIECFLVNVGSVQFEWVAVAAWWHSNMLWLRLHMHAPGQDWHTRCVYPVLA